MGESGAVVVGFGGSVGEVGGVGNMLPGRVEVVGTFGSAVGLPMGREFGEHCMTEVGFELGV